MDNEVINKTKEFVKSHLKEEFTLDELAKYIGYSSYHFAREFKLATGQSVMEYVREQRCYEASKDIAKGNTICNVAMDYCFDTHSGFTKAFITLFGCSPKQFAEHSNKKILKGKIIMENSKIVIRPICKDDVQDLWENVYSAMTPRQITEEYIIPAIENEHNGKGIHLVAQVDGKVVMSLPMLKPYWIPIGFLFDNNYVLTGGDEDIIMGKMLEEMKRQCKMMNVSTIISPQSENSDNVKAFLHFGFNKVFTSDGWDYLMMAIEK